MTSTNTSSSKNQNQKLALQTSCSQVNMITSPNAGWDTFGQKSVAETNVLVITAASTITPLSSSDLQPFASSTLKSTSGFDSCEWYIEKRNR